MMWELGFSSQVGQGQFLAYAILFILCLIAAVVGADFRKGLGFTPPRRWRRS